ncbi:hypothetical protein F0P96_03070 [Hymenobacter busanensis]|uniref:Uncharacterized protein n=1 Tax=Hymenobacter busanensis TaxID=2607656 RepID=A0A7L4ZUZ4_9BACT|nr:hypothetical protein [Hymenobacter busanensis]KAA9339609.1 hypothetical protein F0P96_03070 [Hymenobacter busanensis]QHJ06636.1 hypothetical protein GUY19_04685 [Hymenobacter busanensis]
MKRHLGFLLLIWSLSIGWVHGQRRAIAAPVRPRLPARSLHCTLEAITPDYLAYEPVVLRVRIHNRADSTLTLISALPGSEARRSPRATFYVSVIALDGPKPQPALAGAEFSGIAPADFVLLGPGQSFNPLERMTRFPMAAPLVYPTLPPGVYDIHFLYSTNEPDPAKWGLPTAPRTALHDSAAVRLQRVPRVFLTSNTVRVVVRAQPTGNLARP